MRRVRNSVDALLASAGQQRFGGSGAIELLAIPGGDLNVSIRGHVVAGCLETQWYETTIRFSRVCNLDWYHLWPVWRRTCLPAVAWKSVR